jgi:hypothetical protein
MAENQDKDRLVTLIIAQDNLVHTWVKLLVTVQAGLLLILGFILRPSGTDVALDSKLRTVAVFSVPLFGGLFAIAIGYIIARERKWASWYVERLKNEKLSPTIMPHEKNAISNQPLGRTGQVLTATIVVLVGIWVGVACIIWR